MEVAEALVRLGGVATRAELLRVASRADLDRAVREEEVTHVARGRYALSAADEARRAALQLTGTVCLLSAALAHGWAVKAAPDRPQVAVPGNRKLRSDRRSGVDLHRAMLGVDDHRAGVTTLLDCGRHFPRDEALAVFDSALRSGFSAVHLVALARDARGPGSAQIRLVAGRADARAANPFESVLRDISYDVTGLRVRSQVPIYGTAFLGRPDLVDDELRIVLEADSFAWHGGRGALARDGHRYNLLVVNGWLVLRFAWEDVMFDAGYVREMLTLATDRRIYQSISRSRPA